jgi:DHA1 family multidrug resistance protein-like MFS transporter
MKEQSSRSLAVYTVVSSIWGVVFGFIGPFYVVYVEKLIGGMEKLGIAFSIMILLQSVTTYYAGIYSDRLGRKPFLFITAYADAIVLFLYTVVTEPYQLYMLQGLLGVTNGVTATIRTAILGDMTVREKRGKEVGRFNAIVSLASAVGLAFSGYLVKYYGLKFLFYLASAMVAMSTVLLFSIKEEEKA